MYFVTHVTEINTYHRCIAIYQLEPLAVYARVYDSEKKKKYVKVRNIQISHANVTVNKIDMYKIGYHFYLPA